MAVRMPVIVAVLVLALGAALAPASADPPGVSPVALPPVAFRDAALVVAGPDGETAYTPATLEDLGTYRMVTATPWRGRPAAFDGVLLGDVLAANGLADASAIRVIAENDYAVVIPRSVWTGRPVLIATRVDGRAHRRRERGPLQFVFPMSAEPDLGRKAFEANWVWMAARIEPVE